ncbi:glycosyltransferase family 2 protein [Crocinitomix algicola]|uniref:glycosyltransferase family 2 protein n=1 Tax=Crocinitomix algicola TaxID=1740263 RepID=UPI0008364F11|nr:glycosyltransferase family 2 protein [Crocinitomix algicola]
MNLKSELSIIIPCYNKVEFLQETIDHIQGQSFKLWELILIDDGSTDNTAAIIQKNANQSERIKYVLNTENKGANHCRNQGLSMASGKYILFFDADDLILNDCFQNHFNQIKSNQNFDAWVFNMGVFNEEIGDTSQKYFWKVPEKTDYIVEKFLMHQIPWGTPQVIWSKEAITRIQGFNTEFSRLQDVELHTRALLSGINFKTFPNSKYGTFYRISDKRMTVSYPTFYSEFVASCIKFYQTFYAEVSTHQRNLLVGTIFEALTIISYQKKTNKISNELFKELSLSLLNNIHDPQCKRIINNYLQIERAIPFYVKGLKFYFKRKLKLH